MLYLAALVLLTYLSTCANCVLSFINPPPSGKIGDFSKNQVFATGQTVDIAWSGSVEGKAASIVLYHLNQTTGDWFSDGDMEYIAQRSLAPGFFTWLVGTRKDLAISNLFYLSIFEEGKALSDGNSRYFNITARDAAATRTSSSSSLSTSSTSEAPSSTVLQPSTLSSILSVSTSSASEPTVVSNPTRRPDSSEGSSGSFPDSAKIGLGVGIPVALLLGALAGFFFLRRHKTNVDPVSATAHHGQPPNYPPGPPPSELYSPHKSPLEQYYASSYEAPLRSPVEMR